MSDLSQPLEGVTILDLTLALAGPLACQRLAELGAEVIKVEAPNGGDFARNVYIGELDDFGDSTAFVMMNRNKRSVCIDLKSEAGRAAFYKLVKQADVVVQNFRPGVAERLNISFDTLSAINAKLVFVSITGYGSDGPMADRPGQDLLLQSFCGLTMNGGSSEGNPQPSPVFMVDVIASHLATEAVMAGLLKVARCGEAQKAEVSMIGGVMELQLQEISTYLAHPNPPQRSQYDSATVWMAPPYGIHPTKSGFLAMAQCDLALLAELLNSDKLATLAIHVPALVEEGEYSQWRDDVYHEIAAIYQDKSAAEWDVYLHKYGVWCMVVQDYDTFLNHPQTRQFLTEMEHYKYGKYTTVKPAIDFVNLPKVTLKSAPQFGVDTKEVFAEKGFESQEIEQLLASSAIVQATKEYNGSE